MPIHVPRIFICFDQEHNSSYMKLLVDQAQKSKLLLDFAACSSKPLLPLTVWQQQIAEKIQACHIMIVLVGKCVLTASELPMEIDLACAYEVPYFGIYVDGTDIYTPLPDKLQQARIIPWDWELINKALIQAASEGKNK